MGHDDARPYITNAMKELLGSLGWDISNHSPHSVLVPCDYHVSTLLKVHMGGKVFTGKETCVGKEAGGRLHLCWKITYIFF